MINRRSWIKSKVLKRRPSLIDIKLPTLEKYYQELIELETELKQTYGDLGSGFRSVQYDIDQEKETILRQIGKLQLDRIRPRARF